MLNSFSTTKVKRAISRCIGEAEMWSHPNPTLLAGQHNWEGSHKCGSSPWGKRDLCPTSGTPTLGFFTREMSPQNIWLWNPLRFLGVGNGNSALKGRVCRRPHCNTKAQCERWPNRIRRLICYLRGRVRSLLEPSLGNWALAVAIFALSLSPADARGAPFPCDCHSPAHSGEGLAWMPGPRSQAGLCFRVPLV